MMKVYCLVWAEPKIHAKALFSTFKNYYCMISHRNHHIFITLIKSPWWEHPSQKITAPSANPAWHWNHTINLFMVWTLCLYGSSTGCGWLMALCCDGITPCPICAKKVGLVGAIFTSSKHLLALPWQKSIVCMHRFDLVPRQVWHRCHIDCCLCSSGEDVNAIYQWCIIH